MTCTDGVWVWPDVPCTMSRSTLAVLPNADGTCGTPDPRVLLKYDENVADWGDCDSKDSWTNGETCTPSCDRGYESSGDMTCTDGVWVWPDVPCTMSRSTLAV